MLDGLARREVIDPLVELWDRFTWQDDHGPDAFYGPSEGAEGTPGAVDS